MSGDSDKFSRIVSLRPVLRAPGPAAIASSGAVRLAELVGAVNCCTPHGRHLIVRQRAPEPAPAVFSPGTLRLLLPRARPEDSDPQQWVFLDAETTGLSGGTGTYAFLVGIAWWEGAELAVEQFFMENHGQEASMLAGLAERLSGRRVMVTFNGKSFDCPLLDTRFRMTRLGAFPAPETHLDLLHPARTLWRLRLKSVALSELERHVLDLDRGPDIPSASIPGRYFEFLRGGPPEPLAEIFRHNIKDLQGLASLATHMMRLLDRDNEDSSDGAELFGIAKLLRLRGERELAGPGYEKALARGLPETAERLARRELALMSRGRRDFESASSHWKQLKDESREGMEAYEQLAIYHEHHAGDLREALTITQEALVRLQSAHRSGRITQQQYRRFHAGFNHRLSRLARKVGIR